MWGIQSITMYQYLCRMTHVNYAMIVLFETYRNIKSLCRLTETNSVVGQLYIKNKVIEKDVRSVVTSLVQGRGIE